MTCEIRLAGFGGQGVVLAGYILGKAATLYDRKNAILTQSYGPESRGGACVAEVIISDEAIHYPKVRHPDILVALSQPAYDRYAGYILPEDLILIDLDLVHPRLSEISGSLLAIPATRYAEELGQKIVANMVVLGFLTGVAHPASPEAMQQAILTTVPGHTTELNLKAFERGYRCGSEALDPSSQPLPEAERGGISPLGQPGQVRPLPSSSLGKGAGG